MKNAAKRATPGEKTAVKPAPGKRAPASAGQREAERSAASIERDPPAAEKIEHQSIGVPIVAVGASAGGLDAFCELLDPLPADLNMAFLYVQHLAPKQQIDAMLGTIKRHTRMTVTKVEDGTRVQPNQVYVAPPNTTMRVQDAILYLDARIPADRPHMPIDSFFRSLAEHHGSRAIGIILSGSASDGTLGLKAIKAAGGITFAQDKASPQFDNMPRSALAAGCVDFVRAPAAIAKELTRIARHPYVAAARPSEAPELLLTSQQALGIILRMLRISRGVDFTHYKATTIRRRIARRMALHRIETVEQYIDFLRANQREIRHLYDDILINVTEFFRDGEMFEALKNVVFPRVFREARASTPVRVWVPGCSTGEEVYSIAIAMLEYLGEAALSYTIQIFATDISDRALDQARSGVYPESIVHDVLPERLRRYFTKLESGYEINKLVREMCIFARQNVAKDPPFSKLDLLSCRNVLIYLDPVLQRKVLPVFHYALNPSGFLVLGSSETIGTFSEYFTPLDKKHKIYSRRPGVNRIPLELPPAETPQQPVETPPAHEARNDAEILREADRLVLAKFSPPGVVIDDEFNILQFRGRTGPFLEPPAGAPSMNVLKMAREGLLVELRNALEKIRRTGAAVRRKGLRVKYDGSAREFDLELLPMKRPPSRSAHYLVLFNEYAAQKSPHEDQGSPRGKKAPQKAVERENEQLRAELASTKEYLQSILEEQEASNEELRSANEEIQSSNEELQSTNEELETAKEELQSANEELHTVNEELQTRNLQLSQAGNDLLNLLANISIPIVMLDSDLRIRRFTPASQKVLNLIPTDVGRPVGDIKFNIDVPQLADLLLEVLEKLAPKALEVRGGDGSLYSLRIRPYRTEENKIDGLVLVLVDLDPSKGDGLVGDHYPDLPVHLAQFMYGTEASLAEAAERTGTFALSLLDAQEDERRRVSRELHDELNQRLAALEMQVQQLETDLPPPPETRRSLATLRTSVGELSDRMRTIAYQLHPAIIDDVGLVSAIESYCEQFAQRERIAVDFKYNDVPNIPDKMKLSLYRVIQEGLRNVAKHSASDTCSVHLLGIDNSVNLLIKDEGAGFNANEVTKGLGLRGIQERVRLQGGTLSIKSVPAQGTELMIQIPLKSGAGDNPNDE